MDHDPNARRGRLFGRREMLALLGASGTLPLVPPAFAAEGAATTCVARPEQTEGPYFVGGEAETSDLRVDPDTGARIPGAPLRIEFAVARLANGTCRPLPNATVHLWHCDARGHYSGVQDPGFATVGRRFLRAFQRTDANGLAIFATVYPGWYRGRAVHAHFKVRTHEGGRAREFTSQLYFDDALNDRVLAAEPYNVATRVRNQDDYLFRRAGGAQLMLQPRDVAGELRGRFNLGLAM